MVQNSWWPRFSEAEYSARRARIRQGMKERGLDCLAIYGAPMFFGTDPGSPNISYLAAYAPACHGYLVFPREGEPTLIIYVPSHLANAKEISVLDDVRAGPDLPAAIVARLRELGLDRGRLGVVGNFGWSKVSIPLEHHLALREQLPGMELQDATRWYEDARLLKSPEEIAFMETGASICDRAHEKLRESVRPGVTDAALQNEVLALVHELGGRTPFSHVGSTPMRAPQMIYPSFYSTDRVVQYGDVVLTELASGYGGYFGKIYGTLVVGKPTSDYKQMLELAVETYRGLCAAIKPGIRATELHSAMAGRAAEQGFKSLSYASGWSTYNTRPTLFAARREPEDEDFELQPGLCLNVAGWITSQEGSKGVWVGDTVLVTEEGARRLHSYPVDDLDHIVVC